MGLFDSFIVKIKCPVCKTNKNREIQTKEFANILASYRVGDIVEDATIGEFWLKEEWWCEDCEKNKKDYKHDIYPKNEKELIKDILETIEDLDSDLKEFPPWS